MLLRGALHLSCDSPALLGRVLDFSTFTKAQSVQLLRPLIAQVLSNAWAVRFYGIEENKREVEMDMREMVDKIKSNEPLYGRSSLTPYMQGVAARNSRYTGIWLHVIPWFNFVNHDQVLLTFFVLDEFISLMLCSTASIQLNTTGRQKESLLRSKPAAKKT